MTKLTTVFKNEEADRLLNYFILYKNLITKNSPLSSKKVLDEPEDYGITTGLLKIEEIEIK